MVEIYEYPGFDTIKRYFDLKVYTLEDMKYFTDEHALSKEQFKKIVGKSYTETFKDEEDNEDDNE